MKRRYLTNYLRPDGSERPGTGADAQCFHEYASVENVIKFGLAKPAFPPGQYNIYLWPVGGSPIFVRRAYKRV